MGPYWPESMGRNRPKGVISSFEHGEKAIFIVRAWGNRPKGVISSFEHGEIVQKGSFHRSSMEIWPKAWEIGTFDRSAKAA